MQVQGPRIPTITIAPSRAKARYVPPRVIEVTEATPPEHIFRELVAAYLSAAARVVIHQPETARASTHAVVSSFCERLGDVVSIEEGGESLLLQGPVGPEPAGLGALTFRMGERALELLRDAGRESFPPVTDEEWQRRDDVVDSLAWEVHRRVMRSGLSGRGGRAEERIDAVGWLEASRALERVGDHAVLLAIHWGRWRETEHGPPEDRLLADIHHQAYDYVSSALVILGDPRPAPANAALDHGSALRETIDTLLERLLPAREPSALPPAWAVLSLGGILHSLDRVVAYGQDLVEIALDHARFPRPRAGVSGLRRTSRAMPTKGGTETQ